MAPVSRPAAASGRHLSVGYKIVFGIGALGSNLIAGVYSALLPIFYQDYLGLTAGWIATASLVYALWNAINDPLFGYITDNTRTRWGRRIPYMRFTAPFLALTFILVWFAPQGAGDRALFLWMLATMLLYDTCYTIIGLTYSSLVPELTESDAERNGLQISYSLFMLLGTLLGFVIPDLFRPKSGELSVLPLQMAMVGVGVFGMLMILFTTLKVRERPEFTRVDRPLAFWPSLRFTFASRSFLVLVSANFMSVLVASLLTSMVFYLADYVVKVNTLVLLACIFVPLIGGVPLTPLFRRRFGVVGANQALMLIGATGLLLIPVVPVAAIPACLALVGFGLSGPQTLTNVLYGQVVDEDELRSGVRREGAFFGANALLTKPAQSIALALTPFVLELSGFVSRSANLGVVAVQPAGAVLGIKLVSGLLPGVALLLGALILSAYPLRGRYLDEIKAGVLALHAQKEQALERQSTEEAGALIFTPAEG
jgi:GPH family glycoside/pentoside/hexuronide:cation symporter